MGYWEGIVPWEGGQALAQGAQSTGFKARLDTGAWSNLGHWEVSLLWQGWNWMGFKVSSNPDHSGIL